MKNYIPLVTSLFAGVFSIIALVVSWKVKEYNNKKIRKLTKEDNFFNELKRVYIEFNVIFEEIIKKIQNEENIDNLNSQISKLTAEIRMIASDEIVKHYLEVASLLEDWIVIYKKAYPKAVNGISIVYSKNSDPTKKFKKLEKDIYDDFYKSYTILINEMRNEIKKAG